MPSSNPFYELMGGYYPGDPIQNRKPSPSKRPKIPEFNETYGIVEDYLSDVERYLQKSSMSKSAISFFLGDVERALKAKAGPKGSNINQDRALELGDRGDSAGVQLELDLNPIEWIRDPERKLKKTVGKWKDNFLNWEDYNTYGEQTALWAPLIAGKETTPFIESAFGRGITDIEGDTAPPPKPFQLANLNKTAKKLEPVILDDIPDDELNEAAMKLVDKGEMDPKDYRERTKRLDIKAVTAKGIASGRITEGTNPKEEGSLELASEVDLFRNAGKNFMDFTGKSRSIAGRDQSYRKFANSAAIASAVEIRQNLAAGIIPKEHEATATEFIKRAEALRLANGITTNDFPKYASAENQEDVWAGTRLSVDMLRTTLGKYSMGTLANRKDNTKAIRPGFAKENNLEFIVGNIKGNMSNIDSKLFDVDNWFRAEIKKGVKTQQDLDNFQTETKGMRKMLDSLLGPLSDETKTVEARNHAGKPIKRSNGKSVKKIVPRRVADLKRTKDEDKKGVFAELKTLKEYGAKHKMSDGTIKDADGNLVPYGKYIKIPDKDLEKRMQREAARLNDKLGRLEEKYQAAGILKSDMDKMHHTFMDEHFLSKEMRELFESDPDSFRGSLNLQNVAQATKEKYGAENAVDVVNQLLDDGPVRVLSDHFWNQTRAGIKRFAPATKVENYMKSKHYFGLKYDKIYAQDSGITGALEDKGSKFINNMMSTGRFKNFFENSQVLNFKFEKESKSIKVVGNYSLRFGMDLFERTQLPKLAADRLKMKEVIALINENKSILGKVKKIVDPKTKKIIGNRIIGYSDYSFTDGFDNGSADHALRLASLREWLQKYGEEELGIKFKEIVNSDGTKIIKLVTKGKAGKDNVNKLRSFFTALQEHEANPNFISLLQDKAGALEKFAQKLNVLQDKLFKSKLARIIRPSTYIREVLTRKTIKAITKLLAALAVDLTGGAAAVIWPLIQKVVNVIVSKAVEAGQKLMESIRKNDFTVVEEFLEYGGRAIMQYAAGCVIFFIIITMPIFLVITVILSSITPIDNTRTTVEVSHRAPASVSGNGGYPRGPTSLCNTENAKAGNTSVTECISFASSFDSGGADNAKAVVTNAANYIFNNFGGFTDKLCADGKFEIGWGGSSTACGERVGNALLFGDGDCYTYDPNEQASQDIFIWLLAHEMGHMFKGRESNFAMETAFSLARRNDCRFGQESALPTYVGGTGADCSTGNNSNEDFAQTIANYIAINRTCEVNPPPGCDDFWDTDWSSSGCTFENHLNWVEQHVFN